MDYYDLYCERLGPGLLAEPLNAVTNAAFFVAAWFAWRDARAVGNRDATTRALIALLGSVGIGSTLFHTFATPWARVLDELPILLLQLLFLWSYARRVMRVRRWTAAAFVVAYLVLAIYCRGFPHLLNGSLVYTPALVMAIGLGTYHWQAQPEFRTGLLRAAGLLFGAIVLRTFDATVCDALPIGTHFLWHLLVASVAYLSLRALTTGSAHARRSV